MAQAEHPVELAFYKQMVQSVFTRGRKHYEAKAKIHGPWLDRFENFYRDLGPCPAGKSLKRLDESKPFKPGNVVWG